MKIAAVVVTYNRKPLLLECIAALLTQTRPLDRIFIIDNASSDGTNEIIVSSGIAGNPAVEYVRLDENKGSSGGFAEGVKRAYAARFDWIWIMDDDAEPMPDALERLLDHSGPSVAALACAKINPDGSLQLNHIDRFNAFGPKPLPARFYREAPVPIDISSFVGLLVSRSAIDRCGIPRADFFIWYDDIEYCLRLRRCGPIFLIPQSRIKHKDRQNAPVRQSSFWQRRTLNWPVEGYWKYLCGHRNRLFTLRRYTAIGPALDLFRFSKTLIRVLLFERPRLFKIHWLFKFYADSYRHSFTNITPDEWLALVRKGSTTAFLNAPGAEMVKRETAASGALQSSQAAGGREIRFYLIVATIGRTDDLARLLESLQRQTHQNFHVTVVDQNPDERVTPIVAPFATALSISHLRSAPGLSRARNAALQRLAGDIVAFPDDDCWYPPTLLADVARAFAKDPDLTIVSGKIVDDSHPRAAHRWPATRCRIDRRNVWRLARSVTIFLRSDVARTVGDFDESLGVGSGQPWQSGEETDYLIRALDAGFPIRYDPDLRICHADPPPRYDAASVRRAYNYALGWGHVQKKHRYPIGFVAYYWLRSLVGIALGLALLDGSRGKYYMAILKGRITSWLA
jgi:GT2 family glycosyltransferase